MNREQKEAAVAELTKELGDAEAIFAVDYRGISVPQAAELRAELRNADTSFKVVKNRLTLLAADNAGAADLKKWLEGPTALALVKGDAAAAAKSLTKLGAEFEVLDYKGGIMNGAVLSPEDFKAIAKLPGRDQLNAQLAGIVASPLTGLVRGLGSMIQGLALQLGQIAEQGLVTGEAPAAEEATEETRASEEKPDEKVEAPKDEAAEAAEAESPEASPEEPSGDSVAPTEEPSPDTPAGEAEEVAGDESGEQTTSEDEPEETKEDTTDGN